MATDIYVKLVSGVSLKISGFSLNVGNQRCVSDFVVSCVLLCCFVFCFVLLCFCCAADLFGQLEKYIIIINIMQPTLGST